MPRAASSEFTLDKQTNELLTHRAESEIAQSASSNQSYLDGRRSRHEYQLPTCDAVRARLDHSLHGAGEPRAGSGHLSRSEKPIVDEEAHRIQIAPRASDRYGVNQQLLLGSRRDPSQSDENAGGIAIRAGHGASACTVPANDKVHGPGLGEGIDATDRLVQSLGLRSDVRAVGQAAATLRPNEARRANQQHPYSARDTHRFPYRGMARSDLCGLCLHLDLPGLRLGELRQREREHALVVGGLDGTTGRVNLGGQIHYPENPIGAAL